MGSKWMTQNWTTGDLNALVKNCGEDVARKIQRGGVKVSLEEFQKTFFNKHGRRIHDNLSANVCPANRDFRLNQPNMEIEVDYGSRLARLHEYLGLYTGITALQFKAETERLLGYIWGNSQITNITNGGSLPVILTRRHSDDIGEDLEWQLKGAGKSYIKIFPNRKFYNHRKGTLSGQVDIVETSGYKSVWNRKKKENIIALFFPNPLQGYSINAQRKQMTTLSEFGFILSGAVEPMIMYPDILARDFNTPGLDLSALSWRSASSLGFDVDDDRLGFDGAYDLADARGHFSGGLLFFG